MKIKIRKVNKAMWQGKFIGLFYRLWLLEGDYCLHRDARKLSSLISAHYTVWSNMEARFQGAPFLFKPFAAIFLLPGMICRKRMIALSNRFEEAVGGLDGMRSNELLVFTRVSYAEANYPKAYISAHLVILRDDVSMDNRALALAYREDARLGPYINDIPMDLVHRVFTSYRQAFQLAMDPKYKVRVLKSYADSLVKIKQPGAWNAIWEAEELACANDLGDQLIKIKSLRKRIERGKHLRQAPHN